MSISYEEALATLQAMFGEPWTQESLDTVLRHYQGHMENTVEALLQHGDKDPQVLLQKLKSGDDISSNNNTSLDEELARQLSQPNRVPKEQTATTNSSNSSSAGNNGSSSAPAPATTQSTASYLPGYTPRGKPTTLPDDFLRLQSATPAAAANANAQSTLDSDEALARMLQDQLFSEELRRNPDFAHLAGRPRVSSSNAHQQHQRAAARNSFNAQTNQPMPLPNIMEKLSEMGNSAKFKLTQMADQFKANTNRLAANVGAGGPANGAAGGGVNGQVSPGRRNEMRGLLDRDNDYNNDAYELASRKDL